MLKERTLIFDVDGTLFDSEQLSYQTFKKTLQALVEEGICSDQSWTDEQIKSLIGLTGKDIFTSLLDKASENTIRQALYLLEQIEGELLGIEGQLFPDVKETLSELANKGYSLYVASNGGALYVQRVLERYEIQSYFNGVYSAGLHQTKNKVELVSMLLEEAGKDAVMIGDRTSDIEAGKKNGLKTIGCHFGFGDVSEIAEADYHIHTFTDLLNLLE